MREQEIKPANKKKIAIIILFIIFAALLWINYFLLKPANTITIESLNEFRLKSVTKNHLLFSNIIVTKEKDKYIITSKVTNLTSNILSITPVTMTFKDSDNNVVTQITSYLGNNIKEEEVKTIYLETNENMINVRRVDIEIQTNL